MKYIILISVLLAGCKGSVSEPDVISEPRSDYRIVCLNGVKYYESGKRLSPYIDSWTLRFAKCQEEKK